MLHPLLPAMLLSQLTCKNIKTIYNNHSCCDKKHTLEYTSNVIYELPVSIVEEPCSANVNSFRPQVRFGDVTLAPPNDRTFDGERFQRLPMFAKWPKMTHEIDVSPAVQILPNFDPSLKTIVEFHRTGYGTSSATNATDRMSRYEPSTAYDPTKFPYGTTEHPGFDTTKATSSSTLNGFSDLMFDLNLAAKGYNYIQVYIPLRAPFSPEEQQYTRTPGTVGWVVNPMYAGSNWLSLEVLNYFNNTKKFNVDSVIFTGNSGGAMTTISPVTYAWENTGYASMAGVYYYDSDLDAEGYTVAKNTGVINTKSTLVQIEKLEWLYETGKLGYGEDEFANIQDAGYHIRMMMPTSGSLSVNNRMSILNKNNNNKMINGRAKDEILANYNLIRNVRAPIPTLVMMDVDDALAWWQGPDYFLTTFCGGFGNPFPNSCDASEGGTVDDYLEPTTIVPYPDWIPEYAKQTGFNTDATKYSRNRTVYHALTWSEFQQNAPGQLLVHIDEHVYSTIEATNGPGISSSRSATGAEFKLYAQKGSGRANGGWHHGITNFLDMYGPKQIGAPMVCFFMKHVLGTPCTQCSIPSDYVVGTGTSDCPKYSYDTP